MPTVIDSLVVLLKLDPSEFTEGQKKAAADLQKFADQSGAAFDKMGEKQKKASDAETRQSKDRLSANKAIAESYKLITDKVLGWATAVISTAAIVDFAKNTAQMDAGLGRFAERLDLNKDQMALWVGMLSNVTGSTQASVKSVQQSADALNSVRFAISIGDVSKAGVIQALGLSQADLQDPLQALEKIHQHILAMHMTNRQSTPLLRSLGIDDQTISVLQRGAGEYDQWMDAARRSVPANKESMQAAEDATRAWGELDNSMTQVANDILVKVLPSFTALTRGAAGMAQQSSGPMQQFTGQVETLLDALARLGLSTTGDGSLNLFGKGAVFIFGQVHLMLMWLGTAIYGIVGGLTMLANAAAAAASGDLKGVVAAFKAGGANIAGQWDQNTDKIVDYAHALATTLGTGQIPGGPAAGSGGAGAMPAPRGGAGGGGGIGAQAAAFFAAHGASAAVAAGIGAGITAEGGSPTAVNPTSGAFGIGQWLGERKRALFRFAGTNSPNLQQQLAFMMAEMTGTVSYKGEGQQHAAGLTIINSRNSADAAKNYIARFMRPGEGIYGDYRRAGAALGQDIGGPNASELQAAGAKITIGAINVTSNKADPKAVAQEIPAAVAQASRGLS